MKTKTRMIESKGSGGESWDGVLKLPIPVLVARLSVYLESWLFWALDCTSWARSWSSVIERVGEGVGMFCTGPEGTGAVRDGAALMYWPLWVERKLSSLLTLSVSIQSGYAAKRSVSVL